MIRELMVEKHKFDRFIKQLQRSNELNLTNNGFVLNSNRPHKADEGNFLAAGFLTSNASISSSSFNNSQRNSISSRQPLPIAAQSSQYAKAPMSMEGSGEYETDDSSSINTRNDEDGYNSDFRELDDATKINLDANNGRIIEEEEKAAVASDYNSFLYETIVDQGSARHSELSGMQVRQLTDLPLPGEKFSGFM